MKHFRLQLISSALRIVIMSLTFVLGVVINLTWFEISPPTVTLCDLAHHPDWYSGKVIRVEALARGIYEGIYIVDGSCDSWDAAAGVGIDRGYKLSPDVEAFINDSRPQIRKACIIVTGRFDPNASMGCFGPRFGIDATSIELKSSVTFEPFPRRNE